VGPGLESEYGYSEGLVFSNRFGRTVVRVGDIFNQYRKVGEGTMKERDFDVLGYL
jgi:hypothetical protein